MLLVTASLGTDKFETLRVQAQEYFSIPSIEWFEKNAEEFEFIPSCV
jgi:hypothetical protein